MNPSERKPSGEDRDKGNGSFGDNPWRAMGLIGSVGGTFAACLGLGYWLGLKLDAAQDTGYWSITGMAIGVVVAIVVAILLIRTFTGGKAN
ncbi:AtpZ/AtpI family protein [Paenibacillus solisilvae]|uniref:AtpZ/AtpI family protein n=1 Tax=Paenibacillus solisilvae TaxID=2486751 RepID=A0ABW0VUL0_9BACL